MDQLAQIKRSAAPASDTSAMKFRRQLAREVITNVTVHSEMEETVVYPILRQVRRDLFPFPASDDG